jgi:ferredoxin
MGTHLKYLANVTTLKYSADKCTGCGRCVEVCPQRVFEMRDKRAAITDRDRCMECGACTLNCELCRGDHQQHGDRRSAILRLQQYRRRVLRVAFVLSIMQGKTHAPLGERAYAISNGSYS